MPATTLTDLFGRVCARRPDAPAVTDTVHTLSYRQLDEAADALAARLLALGVGRGDLVGLRVDRTVTAPVAILAILRTGAAYVPLDPGYPAERLRMMVADARLTALVGDPALDHGLGPDRVVDPHAPAPEQPPVGGPPLVPASADVGPDDPAYVIYTSGSTGRPKGCVITHGNVLALLDAALPLFDLDDTDRWSLFHSISFDFSVWELWGALATGATVVMVPEAATLTGEALVALLARERVTMLSQVPSVFRSLVLAHEQAGSPPLDLRYVVFGGESVDLDTARRFATGSGSTARLVNMYGITETTVHATFRELAPADRGSPIGRALGHLAIEVRADDGRPVPPGEPGEMWLTGPGVSAGYLHRPELTAQRFPTVDGRRYYRSGDLATEGPDGQLEYHGRSDQQVKLRGFRIELGEIEAVLRAHPDVADAGVTVWTSPAGARFLVGCVAPAVPADLRAHAGLTLPAHMVPHRYVPVPTLPRTPSGKLDRAALASSVGGRP
ncbi:amino acid adenylation domain-containing protein [Longispora fulva]|uniref:Amino acid adenylation domain-containing protein n=1 Tax=Longispora fulva TaxID=619741 RepID=A0A8J7GN06_9ACTN|nr:amino acid adenylation domain-containing protein [Longispora fulva]MBG6134683.1 amino acid adenylation domain-containing protein [Longispora fulva]